MKFWVRALKHIGLHNANQLADAADVVFFGLRHLGHEVSRTSGDRQIIIGGNLAMPSSAIPSESIIWNLEQAGTFHFSPEYIRLMRRCHVWDYNPINAQRMLTLYGQKTHVLPFGYVPELETVPVVEEDYDVLFTGSLFSEHRLHAIERLRYRGLKVYASDRCYGALKNEMMGRAKVVINIHLHTEKIMESLRIGFALANKKCVLTQLDPDTASEGDLVRACATAPYDKLAEEAHRLVHDPEARREQARLGYEIFKERRMEPALEEALRVTLS